MFCLVYVSTATKLLEAEGLNALLVKCRDNNAAEAITGMLMYVGGNFLQALEGDEAAVWGLYTRIRRDYRHHNVTTLYESPIEQRQFSRWSLALARPEMLGEVEGLKSIARVRQCLAAPGDSAALDDVRTLIQVFADTMR
jgi:hypothetical protein